MEILGRNPEFKHISDVYRNGIDYIIGRQSRIISSLKTPYNRINEVFLNGLEFGSCLTIGARPGWGKTAMMDEIIDSAPFLNPSLDFATLRFQMEMTDKSYTTRDATKVLGLSMREVLSADDKRTLSIEHLKKLKAHHSSKENSPHFFVTDTLTVEEFYKKVINFYKFVNKPIVVGVDHAALFRRAANEGSEQETLYNFSNAIIKLKKIIPNILFIVLTQMNRNIENAERRIEGKIGNYPTSDDIFRGDALQMCSDYVILLARPEKLGISKYGPEKFIVTPGLIVAHINKNRVGEDAMLFFKQNLKHFKLEETVVPQQAK